MLNVNILNSSTLFVLHFFKKIKLKKIKINARFFNFFLNKEEIIICISEVDMIDPTAPM